MVARKPDRSNDGHERGGIGAFAAVADKEGPSGVVLKPRTAAVRFRDTNQEQHVETKGMRDLREVPRKKDEHTLDNGKRDCDGECR